MNAAQDGNSESIDTDFESEETGENSLHSKPWDPSKIRVNTKTFSLRQIVDEINDGSIDLAPDFQRDYVWREKQKTLLIESILLGIPLPAFYFNATLDNSFQVVDGVQRLNTIRDFALDKFVLDHRMEYLKHLTGRGFKDLEPALRRRIHQTQIVAHVIEPTSPLDLKYDIFKRINTGGSPLRPQEIRHCMSKARSRAFLKRLCGMSSFHAATRLRSTKRMEDREMALRFVAFWRLFTNDNNFSNYMEFETLDSFLLHATAELDDCEKVQDVELDQISEVFDLSMRNARKIFGDHAFRKWPNDNEHIPPLNRALFDSWAVSLAIPNAVVNDDVAAKIQKDAREAMTNNSEYLDSITFGTGTITNIRVRFLTTLEIVSRNISK